MKLLAGVGMGGADQSAVSRREHNGGPLLFRPAGAGDVARVVDLIESAYRGDASRAGWTTEADFLEGRRTGADDIESILANPHSRILLAERNGQLLACANVAIDEGEGYFGMFSVKPDCQGDGIGNLVLAEAERIVGQEWGCRKMRMTVIDIREDLIPFYERRGYLRTGIKKPFPYGDERFGIPLRDDLRFEILEKSLS